MEERLSTVVAETQGVLLSMHKQFIHHLNEKLEGDITAEQFFLLQQIYQRSKCTSSELSLLAQVNRSAITVMINRLVNKGYVIRSENKQDRRTIWLEITKEAEPIIEKGFAAMNGVVKSYLSDITEEEFETYLSISKKMYTAMKDQEGR